MFDIGAPELLVIAIVAIFAIGPKELPQAMRTAGRWIGKFRRISGSFRTGIDAMVREAEMEDMDKKWREQNARIMAQYPDEEMTPADRTQGALSAAEAREAQGRTLLPGTDMADDAGVDVGANEANVDDAAANPDAADTPPAPKAGG